jgi:uncharacterized protein YdhG (YjbR/CyaY superfamily)
MSAKQSAAPETVDEYLAAVAEDARGVLQRVRAAIKDAAPDAEETISYRIPLYKLGGKHLIGFGASKDHLSLFVTESEVLRKYERELEPFDHGGTKTTIRFTVKTPLPTALVKKIVKTRMRDLNAHLATARAKAQQRRPT